MHLGKVKMGRKWSKDKEKERKFEELGSVKRIESKGEGIEREMEGGKCFSLLNLDVVLERESLGCSSYFYATIIPLLNFL